MSTHSTNNRRILHCIPNFQIGGAERQLMLLSSLLTNSGWDVHIATLDGGPFESQVDAAATIHRIPAIGNYDPVIAYRIARRIRHTRPTIVQTWLPQMDVLAGAAAVASSTPWVLTEQASPLAYPFNWRYALRHRVGRWADGVVANSRHGLSWWHHKNPRHQFHRVIPNVVQTPHGEPANLPSQSAIPKIVFVGRLVHQKRPYVLLQALRIARDQMNIEGVICGEGPLEDELRAQAETLGLERAVHFAGFVDDVPSYLRQSAMFVSVSAFEGMPNAVDEAMACGTPVVLSDIPEHREIADESCAVFVDGSDPAAVAGGILQTLRNPEATRDRVLAARERVEEWSYEKVATAWNEYYDELIAMR